MQIAVIDSIDRAEREFQGHILQSLETTMHEEDRAFANATLIHTAQPLGNLIVYMLEAESADGFAAWNLFGEAALAEGREYPILRIARDRDLTR